MTSSVLAVQRRINRIMVAAGAAVVVYGTIQALFNNLGLLYLLTTPGIYLVIPVTTLLAVFGQRNFLAIRLFHVLILFLFGVISMWQSYGSFYGIGQFILATILAYEYGFFARRVKLKAALELLVIAVWAEISASRDPGQLTGRGISVIVFIAYFLTILFFIYREEIRRLLNAERQYAVSLEDMQRREKTMEAELIDYKAELTRRETQLELMRDKINTLQDEHQDFDFDKFGISKTEREVIRILCRFSASNREIAERMHISEGTAKVHIAHIFRKMGVNSRQLVIEMCRKNFL